MPYKDPAARRANVHRKEHNREYMKAWRAANPEYMKQYREKRRGDPDYKASRRAYAIAKYHTEEGRASRRRYALQKHYGLSETDYLDMLTKQDHCCAICAVKAGTGKLGKLHVDHDHDTGIVRSLLCFHCNQALGKLKDDPKLVDKAAAYLRKHGRA